MRKYFATAVLALIATAASAMTFGDDQEVDKSVHFGIRAGLNVSKITSDSDGEYAYPDGGDLKSRAGFHVGVIADVPLLKNYFYVTPGLYLTQKGGKYKEEDRDGKTEEKYNPLYLEIPILFSGRYNIGKAQLQINFGPYFAVGLTGKCKFSDIGGDDENEKWKNDIFKKYDEKKEYDDEDNGCGYKRFDAGLSFGVGVTLAKHYYVGIQYELGLVDYFNSDWKKNVKDNYMEDNISYKGVKNRNFMVTVGYNF